MKFHRNLNHKFSNAIIQLSTYDGNKMQQGEDNMARPTRCRRICMEPAYDSFFPDGFLTGEEVPEWKMPSISMRCIWVHGE